MPLLIIKVNAPEGQDSISVNHLDHERLNFLNPLIADIKSREGYFPTGDFYVPVKMADPMKVYKKFKEELDFLYNLLPFPDTGFRKIESMILIPDDNNWITLKMEK